MRLCGSSWVIIISMCSYGSLWVLMRPYCFLLVLIFLCVSLMVPMCSYASIWVLMGSYRFLCVSMDCNGF